jgi:hypothetical protein
MILKSEDKVLIKAYVKWTIKKNWYFPKEAYISLDLLENRNCDYRGLVADYLEHLRKELNVVD